MEKRKVSYHKRMDSKGYVYSQAIRITKNEFIKLNDALRAEIAIGCPQWESYASDSETATRFLKVLQREVVKDTVGWNIYMNHTQRNFVNKLLKAKLQSRNTCLLVR